MRATGFEISRPRQQPAAAAHSGQFEICFYTSSLSILKPHQCRFVPLETARERRRQLPDPGRAAPRRGRDLGARPDARTAEARPRLRLIDWRPCVKKSLRGFATIELPVGLKIHDVPVLVGPKGPWASLPAKPQIDRDGRQKTDASGKPAYVSILEWKSGDLSDRFSAAVVKLVRTAHPDALGERGAT
jgi:hypothetical protein